jgi:hypothetical protein
MAKQIKPTKTAKVSNTHVRIVKGTKKRKGVHSKRNASKLKGSKNYLKRSRGQG